jgi:hypothetical protein
MGHSIRRRDACTRRRGCLTAGGVGLETPRRHIIIIIFLRYLSYAYLIEFLYEYFDIMEEISDDENALDGTNYYLAYNINDQH